MTLDRDEKPVPTPNSLDFLLRHNYDTLLSILGLGMTEEYPIQKQNQTTKKQNGYALMEDVDTFWDPGLYRYIFLPTKILDDNNSWSAIIISVRCLPSCPIVFLFFPCAEKRGGC
jgi:hypothetical protein